MSQLSIKLWKQDIVLFKSCDTLSEFMNIARYCQDIAYDSYKPEIHINTSATDHLLSAIGLKTDGYRL